MPAALNRYGGSQRGFTLIELAVVLAIVTMLLGGLALTLSAQLDLQHAAETRQTLDNVRDALVGFAVANGRLPCPAVAPPIPPASCAANQAAESPSPPTGSCTVAAGNVAHGFIPGLTLGITPTDKCGYVLDGWGFPVRYSVFVGTLNAGSPPTCNNTITYSNAFTTAGRMRSVTMSCLLAAPPSVNPLLYVCASAAGTNTSNCGSAVALTTKTPAVIYSTGKNSATGGTGADEIENPNPNSGDTDAVFVFHDVSAPGAPGGEFDDQMTWISLPVLFNRMIAGGQLP
jgi:prepilin-type N-terminal cleavage/methylation domain-containing protein